MTPASIIPVFGSQRPYADLNFAGGSFGLDGRSVSDLTALPGFTFTRASLAMGYDATGKLTYGPNNLCLQSNTFSNASWTKINGGTGSAPTVTSGFTDPDGGTLAWRLQASAGGVGGSDYSVLRQTCSGAPSAIRSLYVKSNTGSSQSVYFGNPNSSTPVTATTSWTRVSYKDGTANNFIDVGAYPAAASGSQTVDILIYQAQLEAVTYQTTPGTYYPTTTAAYYGPRLVYDPVTLASQGILVEEARTNLLLQSQTLDNVSWTTTDVTVGANATTSPDGTSNADSITEGVATSTHRVYQSVTTTAVPWTASVYAKPNGRSWVYFRFQDSANVSRLAFFNVTTGVVGTLGVGVTGGTITNVGNGWYRCSATMTMFAGAQSVVFGISSADGAESYTGNGTGSAYFYQAQLEAGTGASSPIPTTTAAVTRAADQPVNTGLSVTAPCTVVVDFQRARYDTSAFPYVVTLTDGTSNNVAGMYAFGTSFYSPLSVGGVSQGDLAVGVSLAINTPYGASTRFQQNDRRGALNGALGTADTSDLALPTLTNLYTGTSQSGGNSWNGTISRIRIYNRALPDAQLQSLTT